VNCPNRFKIIFSTVLQVVFQLWSDVLGPYWGRTMTVTPWWLVSHDWRLESLQGCIVECLTRKGKTQSTVMCHRTPISVVPMKLVSHSLSECSSGGLSLVSLVPTVSGAFYILVPHLVVPFDILIAVTFHSGPL